MKGYKTCETELSPTIYDQTQNNTNYHNLSYEKRTRGNCSYKANNRVYTSDTCNYFNRETSRRLRLLDIDVVIALSRSEQITPIYSIMTPNPSSFRPVGQYPIHDAKIRYGR